MKKKPDHHYLVVGGIKFTIKPEGEIWKLDFYHKGDRHKRSTFLKKTKANLIEIEKVILPQIVEELTNTGLESNTITGITSDITLEEMAKEHFALHQHNVRDHVYNRDLSNYNGHILPYFKGRSLNSIKPIEIIKWQNRLLAKYKFSTVKKYRSIFYSIYTLAINNDYVEKNPLSKVSAPKVKKSFHNYENDLIKPFNTQELDLLTNKEGIDDDSYMPNFIKFMANTGIRPGEIIALNWEDINFEKKTISITKTIVNNKIGLPKTKSSIRQIDMLTDAFDALKKQFELTGAKNGAVFLNSCNSRFYNADILNINFQKRLKNLNIDIRPLYQMRHSFASRMIQAGVDLSWISKTLGHKDPSITLSVYTKYIVIEDDIRLSQLEKIEKKLSE